ncbi:hypothetical protein CQA66_05770 [Helicobacter aurati]|uniref:Flagellar FliJ protein n=1 Tax=Helicobacter aurati TaxID=137778 RepID=A0A3D8J3A1_9HELI|nr:flagellar FliJ family protein [Helicobacter aurati]RDU71968.1 hypothetical protein CQA66_05770 [Helicobacter aurati]
MLVKLVGLVKIAKQKLLEQERMLLDNQARIMKMRTQIDVVNAQIAQVSFPSKGHFGLYQIQMAGVQAYLYEIEEIRKQIAFLLKEQEVIKQNIRIAHINHEKMVYIYNQEKNKRDAHIKNLEEKRLDELTTILHARNK